MLPNLPRRGKTNLEIRILEAGKFVSGAGSLAKGHLLNFLLGRLSTSFAFLPRLRPRMLHKGQSFVGLPGILSP